jgi:hypothetical protein
LSEAALLRAYYEAELAVKYSHGKTLTETAWDRASGEFQKRIQKYYAENDSTFVDSNMRRMLAHIAVIYSGNRSSKQKLKFNQQYNVSSGTKDFQIHLAELEANRNFATRVKKLLRIQAEQAAEIERQEKIGSSDKYTYEELYSERNIEDLYIKFLEKYENPSNTESEQWKKILDSEVERRIEAEMTLLGADDPIANKDLFFFYNRARNCTEIFDNSTKSMRPLDGSAHKGSQALYDVEKNVTWLENETGQKVFFHEGDNRTADTGYIPPQIADWWNNLGNWRLSGNGRLGLFGQTWQSHSVVLSNKSNYKKVGTAAIEFLNSSKRKTDKQRFISVLFTELGLSMRTAEYRNIPMRQWVDLAFNMVEFGKFAENGPLSKKLSDVTKAIPGVGQNATTAFKSLDIDSLPLYDLALNSSKQMIMQLKASALRDYLIREMFDANLTDLQRKGYVNAHINEIAVKKSTSGDTILDLSLSPYANVKSLEVGKGKRNDALGSDLSKNQTRDGYGMLDEELKINRVTPELKHKIFPLADILPGGRWGREKRPEIDFVGGIPAGTDLGGQFWNQANAAFKRSKTHFQLAGTSKLHQSDIDKLQGKIKNKNHGDAIAMLRSFIAEGKLKAPDLSNKNQWSYIPVTKIAGKNGVLGNDSGMRLSAVVGKQPFNQVTDLTGKTRLNWSFDQTNLDLVFNDLYSINKKIPNMDRTVHKFTTKVKSNLYKNRPYMTKYMENPEVSLADIFTTFIPAPAVRHTISKSIPFGIGKIQGRGMFKSGQKQWPLLWLNRLLSAESWNHTSFKTPKKYPTSYQHPIDKKGRWQIYGSYNSLKKMIKFMQQHGVVDQHYMADNNGLVDSGFKSATFEAMLKDFQKWTLPKIKDGKDLDRQVGYALREFFNFPPAKRFLSKHSGWIMDDLRADCLYNPFTREKGSSYGYTLEVPQWLTDLLQQRADKNLITRTPVGGQDMMLHWLHGLEQDADSNAKLIQRIENFKTSTLPKMVETAVWSKELRAEIDKFLIDCAAAKHGLENKQDVSKEISKAQIIKEHVERSVMNDNDERKAGYIKGLVKEFNDPGGVRAQMIAKLLASFENPNEMANVIKKLNDSQLSAIFEAGVLNSNLRNGGDCADSLTNIVALANGISDMAVQERIYKTAAKWQ